MSFYDHYADQEATSAGARLSRAMARRTFLACRDLLVAHEPWQDREPRGVGGRPAVGSEARRAQVVDGAGARGPGRVRARARVVQHHFVAGERGHLGDAGAHDAGAHDEHRRLVEICRHGLRIEVGGALAAMAVMMPNPAAPSARAPSLRGVGAASGRVSTSPGAVGPRA